ncbi:MAG: hypothetical protein IPJ77_02600 [Planctomycetes bacterium]|nr:hypothetical protein [Planctomycetota bacterium]
MPHRDLARLEALRDRFGLAAAREKTALVARLLRASLRSAREVERLHEALVFLRAYPDDARLLALVVRGLERFDRRADLRRHREAIADTGIAGTDVRFRFYQPTAARLARRYPGALWIDWEEFDAEERGATLLSQLLPWAETQSLDDERSLRERLDALRGRGEGDGAFLVRRIDALPAARDLVRHVHDELDPPLVLRASKGTPSRSRAVFDGAPRAFQARELRRERPVLAATLQEPPRSIRALAPNEARALVELAQDAMAVRARDLDAFMYADERDARLVDCGDGLAFAALGVVPEQRLLLESVYAFLTLKNGVPIGYVLASSLWNSCEVAYNVFETYRGGEAAWIYGRVLAMLRAFFAADTFQVVPYQLGHENEEGLRSGAWWFYQKLGFQPRAPEALRLVRAERARLARDPAHRSSLAVLRRLVRHDVFWSAGAPREDVLGRFPSHRLGSAVSALLAREYGAERERGVDELAVRNARRLGVRSFAGWTDGERLAWLRWAPLLALVPDLPRWSASERAALVRVVRAKGGRRESDFVRAFDAHARLRKTLCRLAGARSSV